MYRVVVTEKHFGTFFLQNFVAEDELDTAHCSNRYTDRIPGDHVLSHGSLHTQSIRRGKTVGAVFQYFAL